MNRIRTTLVATAAAAMVALGATAAGAYTLDDAGYGFVGKGEVQTVLGLNNAGVQALGNPSFTTETVTVSETTWECYNENNGKTQERARTTTTEKTGVVSSIARVKNQITGYNLTGFSADTSTEVSTEGPPLNSCPNANSSFVLGSTVSGDPVVVSGGLYVNGVLLP